MHRPEYGFSPSRSEFVFTPAEGQPLTLTTHLLRQYAYPNQRDNSRQQRPLLCHLIVKQRLDLALALLQNPNGLNVNLSNRGPAGRLNKLGNSALHYAVVLFLRHSNSALKEAYVQLIHTLLEYPGLRADYRNASGKTALDYMQQKAQRVARFAEENQALLDKLTEITEQSANDFAHLEEGTVRRAFLDAAEVAVIEHSPRTLRQSVTSSDALEEKTLRACFRFLEVGDRPQSLELTRYPGNIRVNGRSLLHAAIEADDAHSLKYLVQHRLVPVNAQDSAQATALHRAFALCAQNFALAERLLTILAACPEVDWQVTDAQGRMPLVALWAWVGDELDWSTSNSRSHQARALIQNLIYHWFLGQVTSVRKGATHSTQQALDTMHHVFLPAMRRLTPPGAPSVMMSIIIDTYYAKVCDVAMSRTMPLGPTPLSFAVLEAVLSEATLPTFLAEYLQAFEQQCARSSNRDNPSEPSISAQWLTRLSMPGGLMDLVVNHRTQSLQARLRFCQDLHAGLSQLLARYPEAVTTKHAKTAVFARLDEAMVYLLALDTMHAETQHEGATGASSARAVVSEAVAQSSEVVPPVFAEQVHSIDMGRGKSLNIRLSELPTLKHPNARKATGRRKPLVITLLADDHWILLRALMRNVRLDINASDTQGNTVMHYVVTRLVREPDHAPSLECLQQLLNRPDVRWDFKNARGECAYALLDKRREALLSEGFDVALLQRLAEASERAKHFDRLNKPALVARYFASVEEGQSDESFVPYYIGFEQAYAWPAELRDAGDSILHRAIRARSIAKLRFLLSERLGDVNKRDSAQDTALHLAINVALSETQHALRCGKPSVLTALLTCVDIDWTARDAKGRRPATLLIQRLRQYRRVEGPTKIDAARVDYILALGMHAHQSWLVALARGYDVPFARVKSFLSEFILPALKAIDAERYPAALTRLLFQLYDAQYASGTNAMAAVPRLLVRLNRWLLSQCELVEVQRTAKITFVALVEQQSGDTKLVRWLARHSGAWGIVADVLAAEGIAYRDKASFCDRLNKDIQSVIRPVAARLAPSVNEAQTSFVRKVTQRLGQYEYLPAAEAERRAAKLRASMAASPASSSRAAEVTTTSEAELLANALASQVQYMGPGRSATQLHEIIARLITRDPRDCDPRDLQNFLMSNGDIRIWQQTDTQGQRPLQLLASLPNRKKNAFAAFITGAWLRIRLMETFSRLGIVLTAEEMVQYLRQFQQDGEFNGAVLVPSFYIQCYTQVFMLERDEAGMRLSVPTQQMRSHVTPLVNQAVFMFSESWSMLTRLQVFESMFVNLVAHAPLMGEIELAIFEFLKSHLKGGFLFAPLDAIAVNNITKWAYIDAVREVLKRIDLSPVSFEQQKRIQLVLRQIHKRLDAKEAELKAALGGEIESVSYMPRPGSGG